MEGFSTRFKELGHKADYTDSKTLELLGRAVARWVAALKANGIDLSNCYEPIHDEPNSKILDDFIAIARVLRRHGLKVAVDLATWCSLDDARPQWWICGSHGSLASQHATLRPRN